jgi:lipopolysaccharide transport system permease protein
MSMTTHGLLEEQGTTQSPRRIHIRPRRGWSAIDLGELWRGRELAWMFALRDVKVRYKQTFFGYAWAVVVPSIQVLVFSVVFGAVLGVGDIVDETAGRKIPYPLFALCGQIVWNFFKMSVDGGSRSLLDNAHIIRKIYVPRLLLPIASIGKPAVDTAVAYVLLLGLTVWYATDPDYEVWVSWKLVLTPALLILAVLPALAVSLISSAVTVHYRDLQYILPFALSIAFYVTPVIYPVQGLPEGWAWVMYLNPVAGLVEAHRACVLDDPLPWGGLAMSVVMSSAALLFGAFYFTRAERQFADVA